MFRARLPSIFTISAQLTNCHACHGICTLSPLDAALPMRFAKNTQHHTSKVMRLPRKMTLDTSKVLHLHENYNVSCENVAKVLCLPHKTAFGTLQNTSECHKVPRLPRDDAKRSKEALETSKNDPSCRTYHRHGHRAIARTVAHGCERLRTETRRPANTLSAPRPPV